MTLKVELRNLLLVTCCEASLLNWGCEESCFPETGTGLFVGD